MVLLSTTEIGTAPQPTTGPKEEILTDKRKAWNVSVFKENVHINKQESHLRWIKVNVKLFVYRMN